MEHNTPAVRQVAVPSVSLISNLYGGAHLLDAFATALLPDEPRDARVLATRLLTTSPPWVRRLLRVRDALVRAFGIKTSAALLRAAGNRADHISFMRVYQTADHELVLGEDDRHLDFRLSVLVRPVDGATQSAHPQEEMVWTTVVHCHNLVGRIYLLVISPFHRLIVRNTLRRLHNPKAAFG